MISWPLRSPHYRQGLLEVSLSPVLWCLGYFLPESIQFAIIQRLFMVPFWVDCGKLVVLLINFLDVRMHCLVKHQILPNDLLIAFHPSFVIVSSTFFMINPISTLCLTSMEVSKSHELINHGILMMMHECSSIPNPSIFHVLFLFLFKIYPQ